MIGCYCYKYAIVITNIIIAETTPFNISVQIITVISASCGRAVTKASTANDVPF